MYKLLRGYLYILSILFSSRLKVYEKDDTYTVTFFQSSFHRDVKKYLRPSNSVSSFNPLFIETVISHPSETLQLSAFNPLFIETLATLTMSTDLSKAFNPLFIETRTIAALTSLFKTVTFNPLFIETRPGERLGRVKCTILSILFSSRRIKACVWHSKKSSLSILFSSRLTFSTSSSVMTSSPFNPLFIETDSISCRIGYGAPAFQSSFHRDGIPV